MKISVELVLFLQYMLYLRLTNNKVNGMRKKRRDLTFLQILRFDYPGMLRHSDWKELQKFRQFVSPSS